MSLSARRAWIEMALDQYLNEQEVKSLSARRAWIEILVLFKFNKRYFCRSPQGERG